MEIEMAVPMLQFTLNGQAVEVEIPADLLLVDLLREYLGLTGTKKGCGSGDCGACTVIINGKAANSCLFLAMDVQGKLVTTVEGLGVDDQPDILQKAFLAEGAVQCGFCTPGMLMSAKALLDSNPRPTRNEIKRAMAGNLCRCTGYIRIVKAIERAGGQLNG